MRGPASQKPHRRGPYGAGAARPDGSFYNPAQLFQIPAIQFPVNVQYSHQPPSLSQLVFQNPSIAQPQNTFINNAGFLAERPFSIPPLTLEAVDSASAQVHKDLVNAGEHVSAWKVSQHTLFALKVDSWSLLRFQPQDIPTLHRLFLTEGKVNSFIHCFVCARIITSLYELKVSLCQNMDAKKFEDLGLGPFLHHPLIKHYFNVPPDLTEVFKINSEEIIHFLQKFIRKLKNVSIEKFLIFVAEQKSVSIKEKLGVRIQDLWFLVHHIRKASKEEETLFSEKLDGSRDHCNKNVVVRKLSSRRHEIAVEKQSLDKRFYDISNSVETFTSKWIDSGNQHAYFPSSDDSNDSKKNDAYDGVEGDEMRKTGTSHCQSTTSVKDSGQFVSSCPYPSNSEEMVRLGLKHADNNKSAPTTGRKINEGSANPFKRKLKHKNNKSTNLSSKYLKKGDVVDLEADGQMCDLTLNNGDIEKFVATWRVACHKNSLTEVLDMMLSFYMAELGQRKKIRQFVSCYPVIGLLNVAVSSIKRGGFESIYDTFQSLNEKELMGTDSAGFGEMIDVGPVVEACDPIVAMNCSYRVTHDDIIKKITNYFEIYEMTPKQSLPLVKPLTALKKLYDCETWLMDQFKVQEFCSLGHGRFSDFLENHISMLPLELHSLLSKEFLQESSVKFCLNQQQLGVMLSQAVGNNVVKADTASLLKKQFTAANFNLIGVDSQKDFVELINSHKEISKSSCILYSACLLGGLWNGNHLVCNENSFLDTGEMVNEIAQEHVVRRTSKDAVECLLKAPMLSDILYWSHWDVLYAPSLGPLPEFLLNKVNFKNLLCIVTVDGKYIRIDHTATVDEFLESLVQCSPFHIALKFLSLLGLYGGACNAPVALLKCYAQKAMDVIIQNSADSVEDNVVGQNSLVGQSLSTHSCGRSVNSDGIKKCNTNFDQSTLCKVNDAIPTISRIILKFFQYLPSEFRNLAAEIFLPGLGFYTKLAPTVLLNQCSETMERIMLHDIGLSLGIAEWVIDHHQFCSSTVFDLSVPPQHAEQVQSSYYLTSALDCSNSVQVLKVSASGNQKITHGKISDGLVLDGNQKFNPTGVNLGISLTEFVDIDQRQGLGQATSMGTKFSDEQALHDATVFVESIRFEEFGLSPHSSKCEDRLLKKQHARLGRALQCLSQELYSQDSHFILELVQNADDNMYPNNVEPELVFILQETGIVVLNNEFGFSAENIRALCDVGNSTKKGSGGGYIGKKGIGFKSVFRVTDAPEIHSNGFHVKFDITEGQIGFVLPTVVPPCATDTFKQYLYGDDYQGNDDTSWNTCILLPFRSQKNDGTGVSSIISMFSDLHPSLLLFLHRLKCIKFRNLLSDRFIVMRKETLHDGIVKISHGEEVLSWLVISKKLRSSFIRTDVDATEISMAFTLQETDYGEYKPILRNQPVFSFLPLRNYGLKFILQGDFVLPSSREEVIGDSAWNQWLLSEFPSLFFIAEKSFCALPCFVENPGKAVTIYMSFVPLPGEVHGFFSRLPQMIISFLRRSSCLLQDSPDLNWVLPCRVLRGWNEQARLLLSDFLLQTQLGLVYLHKDILLSDSLAMALGVQNYGPKILVEVIESVCHFTEYLKSLGIEWLSAWFCTIYSSLSKQCSLSAELEYDITYCLKHIPLIPLSDGSYGRVSDGPIWLPCDVLNKGPKTEYRPKDFPYLYNNLKIVTPQLFSVSTKNSYIIGDVIANNIMQMLIKIGVQQMSSHEVLRSHILVALSNEKSSEDRNLMIEYLTFIMLHLQSDCASCHFERQDIITTLQKLPLLLTNYGFKSSFHESIHFGREYGNPVDVVTLFDSVDIKWIEVDSSYLKHPASLPLSSGLVQWRAFFIDLGVTDFVRVIATEKSVEDFLSEGTINISSFKPATSFVKDWESPELVNMLSIFSSKNLRTKCIYLLEVFDKMWDDCYSFQAKSFFIPKTGGTQKPFISSFMKCIHEFAWIASTMDQDLHQPNNLFYDCEQIRSVLGTISPYAVPKVNNKVFANDLGFKMEVSLNDALEILQLWKKSQSLFVASIAQMLKFYILISNGIATSSSKIIEDLKSSCFIFVPLLSSCQNIASVSGIFLSPMEVYWEDPTGCVDRMKELWLLHKDKHILCKSLQTVYPTLHDFFVNVCGVPHTPSFSSYFQILQQLSSIALPSESAHKVFQVLVRWADNLNSGLISTDQMSELKENFMKLENTVLPTEQDKWVSLHPSFGLICWSDDYMLKKQFKHSDGVDFIQFGELSVEELSMLSGSVATFLHSIGVPSLSKIVLREAIFYGAEENRDKVSLVNGVISYAQRYIHNLHLDIYLKLKQLGFEKLGQLQVVVVRQLFYKNILPDHHCASRQRFECNCLLQGNTLYATQTADAHSIFLELSRFFFDGSTDLHFANFLHMVITMAQSGSTVEQTEYFVVNSQKIPKLPDDEPSWSIASTCKADMPCTSQPVPMPSADHLHHEFSKPSGMKQCINSDWPPPDWKTAPGFERPRFGNLWKLPSNNSCLLVDSPENSAKDVALVEDRASDENAIEIKDPVSVEITGDWAAEEDSMASGASALMHSEPPVPPKLIEKIDLQIPDEHLLCRATGRFGELIAFRFLAEKYGPAHVKWVNEEAETGLPYDLEVVGNEEDRQYIEVKSTRSLTKRWFDISVREWKFAAEKGDSYSIAHVSILGQHKARVTLLKNPYQLVRQKFLGLALSMPRY